MTTLAAGACRAARPNKYEESDMGIFRPSEWTSSEKHPANTIRDHDWFDFNAGRAKALNKMSDESYEKHKNTWKQAKSGKEGRN